MTTFSVPELPAGAFTVHYRHLVRDALLRSAEGLHELHLQQGHRVRARRAERAVLRLRELDREAEPRASEAPAVEPRPIELPSAPAGFADRWFGHGSRAAVRVTWFGAAALLIGDILVFGVRSWQAGAADIGLILLTFLWFAVSVEDLVDPPEQQLRLFE